MQYTGKNRVSELLDLFERAGSAKRKIALLYAMVNDNKINLDEFSHLLQVVEADRRYEEYTNGTQTKRWKVPIRS